MAVIRLTPEQREEAEALLPEIIENPEGAAYEIIYLRARLAAWQKAARAIADDSTLNQHAST